MVHSNPGTPAPRTMPYLAALGRPEMGKITVYDGQENEIMCSLCEESSMGRVYHVRCVIGRLACNTLA